MTSSFWKKLNEFVEDYVDSFDLQVEGGEYHPNDFERYMLKDCISNILFEMHQSGMINTEVALEDIQRNF